MIQESIWIQRTNLEPKDHVWMCDIKSGSRSPSLDLEDQILIWKTDFGSKSPVVVPQDWVSIWKSKSQYCPGRSSVYPKSWVWTQKDSLFLNTKWGLIWKPSVGTGSLSLDLETNISIHIMKSRSGKPNLDPKDPVWIQKLDSGPRNTVCFLNGNLNPKVLIWI